MEPKIKVVKLEMDDPTFAPGLVKTARATLTNPTTAQFTYSVELYLGVGKAATSGVGSVTIGPGTSSIVDFTLTTPAVEGNYPVYLDVRVAGELIAHYQGTENVTILVTPAIVVGPITWV